MWQVGLITAAELLLAAVATWGADRWIRQRYRSRLPNRPDPLGRQHRWQKDCPGGFTVRERSPCGNQGRHTGGGPARSASAQ